MIAFRFKVHGRSASIPGPGHYRVQVFVGEDFDHLALSGELVMRPAEFEAFAKLNGVPAFDHDHNLIEMWDVGVGPVLQSVDENR